MAATVRKLEVQTPSSVTSPSGEDYLVLRRPCARNLSLSRERIAWRTTPSSVEIQVDLLNEDDAPSVPAILVVEAAPLGAFVPGWRVATVPVDTVPPGESVRIVRSIPDRSPHFDLPRIAMDGGFGADFPRLVWTFSRPRNGQAT